MNIQNFFLPFCILLSCSCNPIEEQHSNKSSASTTSFASQNPKEVVQAWQSLLDAYELEQAKSIASPEAQQFLDLLASYGNGLPKDSLITTSEILNIECIEKQNQATCYTLIRDLTFKEIYRDTFDLILEDNNWLITVRQE